MILINKEEYPIHKLASRLGITIPIDKLTKKPMFEINPAFVYPDRANGPGATKHRNMMEFPADFRTKLKTGENVEIRYCTSRRPDPKTNGASEKYSPRVVEFDGKAEYIKDDLDKAVYFWLHFYNKTSPFVLEGRPHEYELVDDDAKADLLIKTLTLKGQATSHAASLSGQEMIIIAKGMKIPGASTMEPMMIKAQLMQYANERPAEYMNLAQSQVNHVHGLIYDAIDKGIFLLEHIFNAKRWKWAKGAKTGQVITEMSSSVQDDREALIHHITQTAGQLNEILPVLINTAMAENSTANIENTLKDVNVLDMLKGGPTMAKTIDGSELSEEEDVFDNDETDFDDDTETNLFNAYLPLPTTFEEAKNYLFKHIEKKTPALASELLKRVTDKTLNEANMEMAMEEFKTK